MSQTSKVLQKNPPLEASEDFYRLRREGIGFIAEMGSRKWTDYNVHDPGITILEALCYAMTDLGYRFNWDIADILSPQTAPTDPLQPYPQQAFFTARNILSVNPVTPDDLRRLLIDLDSVRNAWVVCKQCACDASYFAWCENDALILSYTQPDHVVIPAPVEVSPQGLYEALLELEEDPELGDLNDRKIEFQTVFHDTGGAHTTILELRFPDISLANGDQWQLFVDTGSDPFASGAFNLTLTRLGATQTFNVFTDLTTDADRDNYIRNNWRTIFYASFEIQIVSSGNKIVIENAALRLLGDSAARNATTAKGLQDLLQDKQPSGFIQSYRRKAQRSLAAVQSAKAQLSNHRNLDEDYCIVDAIGIEEVAVCADVQVTPDADIELVQAQIWFEIEQYLNPLIRFHTLQELRDAGEAVESIFEGPELDNGFIQAGELTNASLRAVVRGADLIDRLVSIDGVIAVNRLLLTRYDSEGNPVTGVADPTWVDGNPVFDPNKLSASWLLFISSRHAPRLYLNQSRFLFYKGSLSFLPRMDAATDTLNQLHGNAERPKNPNADNDLPIPKGTFRDPGDYYPVQHSFPLTYGIGQSGLPSTASAARRAQAKQLKAYLTVFEQLLGNALAQLAHTSDLFSLDPAVVRTYFVKLFDPGVIAGFDTIAEPAMTQAAIEAMTETPAEFYERRNRFLDHLLARFGEDFNEYALLLTDAAGTQVAQPRLIENKIAFLKRYPQISHDRGKAFNYTSAPCSEGNYPGIKKRITLLLGYPDLSFVWTVGAANGGNYPLSFQLIDQNGRDWLDGNLTVTATGGPQAQQAGYATVIRQMVRADAYEIASETGQFRLKLNSAAGVQIGQTPQLFRSMADAAALRDQLMAWSATERMLVVEHLLLRPKFPGDALYPACCPSGCGLCGDEDPYSFRLTFVMPGWVPQYTDNLDLRHFAERTIQQETPAHLLGKTCWVGNDGFIENLCDDVISKLADLLIAQGLTAAGTAPTDTDACACANAIYHAFSVAFTKWYEDKTLDFIHADALSALIGAQFAASVKSSDVTCTTVFTDALWAQVQSIMTSRFVDSALNGWQFERFENAWCAWLDANAAIDWTEERLIPRVQAILTTNLLSTSVADSAICDCAKAIVTQYGTSFFNWMQTNVTAGNTLENLTQFNPPAVSLCAGMNFKAGTLDAIVQLLAERYNAYKKVSYRLWVVVSLLGNLRSTYPGATLHDCDQTSDLNPVRLDNTALGNYPLRTTLT